MPDPHAPFIIASYAAWILITGGLIVRLVLDQRAQKRALAELEARGGGRGRRSGGGGAVARPVREGA